MGVGAEVCTAPAGGDTDSWGAWRREGSEETLKQDHGRGGNTETAKGRPCAAGGSRGEAQKEPAGTWRGL